MGWGESPPTYCVVSCKNLRDEGLHNFKGMLGYCVEDNGEEHFGFVHHNVSAIVVNGGKMEYIKFGKVGLSNCVSMSHSNVFQRAHQWARFRMKKHLGATFVGTLFNLCKIGQLYHNPIRVIHLRLANIRVRRTTSIWKIMMNPYDLTMEDISNVFSNTIIEVSNMRCVNAQQTALHHRVEEREINHTLQEPCWCWHEQ